MKILVTIPHYFKNIPGSAYGSHREAAPRIAALSASLSWLRQSFGTGNRITHSTHPFGGLPANQCLSSDLDIIICTTQEDHLLTNIPSSLYQHVKTKSEPLYLGYECHAILRDQISRYDWFVYLEDDLVITDPLLFHKIRWFVEQAGEDATLLPNRFERHPRRPDFKLYIDGQTQNPEIASRFQDRSDRPEIKATLFDQEWMFKRVDNSHSGAFFLTRNQMEHFAAAPHFLQRSADFWSPLESAATLGLMQTFRVYKPALRNAAFLEMLHAHNRELRTESSTPAGNS